MIRPVLPISSHRISISKSIKLKKFWNSIDPVERLRRVHELMAKEIEVLEIQNDINTQARGEMDKSQREFYLRQQMKAIQQELGEGNELQEEIEQYRDKIKKAKMPEEVAEEAERQLGRLERMHPDAAETATLRNYLDWMIAAALDEIHQRQSRSEKSAENPR